MIGVYDDHANPDVFIKNIIGEKSFGNVILKRVSIREKAMAFLRQQEAVEEVLEFNHPWQLDILLKQIRDHVKGNVLFHIFSEFVVSDRKAAGLLIQKMVYAERNYVCICGGAPVFLVMTDPEEYCRFLTRYADSLRDIRVYTETPGFRFEKLSTKAFLHIGDYEIFLRYISGGFDVRFFNSVISDDYTVVKSSGNKEKIHAEYQFYQLLPDDMKRWFVMPYDYRESEKEASYRMERYHVPDLAIRWVHGAISLDEMDRLLAKVFHFLSIRRQKIQTPEEYEKTRDALYLIKVRDRAEQLKKHKLYPLLNEYIVSGCEGLEDGLDGLIRRYEEVYHRKDTLMKDGEKKVSVIGHGDLCFSNMLYNRDADLLKLIDPKGAVEERQLWTDPYYDVAKLSHSICGLYDFFNSGLHQIVLDTDLRLRLEIDFDNEKYKKLFRRHAEANGYIYPLVRLYEVSLFLSMLPLHMDNPQKVLGFILNAVRILEEVEMCLKS